MTKDENIDDNIERGKICKWCREPLTKKYGQPIACEDCGGNAKLTRLTETQSSVAKPFPLLQVDNKILFKENRQSIFPTGRRFQLQHPQNLACLFVSNYRQ